MKISVIVPFHNDITFLERTLPGFQEAIRRHGDAELVIVDNGSDPPLSGFDGPGESVVVRRIERSTIGKARNVGAEIATGEILVFCDADIVVPPDHLTKVETILRDDSLMATGSNPSPSADPNWVEHSWHRLHEGFPTRPSQQDIPSGNFIVRRDAFDEIGGFDPSLVTGEDAEICQRLRDAGHRVVANDSLEVIHLGNPKTVGDFFRRNVWHGLGMFGTARLNRLDKPTVALAGHLILTLAGLATLVATAVPVGLVLLLLSQLALPLAAVAYRLNYARAVPLPQIARVVFLYWIYLWARALALALILTGRESTYKAWASKRRDQAAVG